MDKVLIVDHELENLRKAREGFKDLHHFELLTATSIKDGIFVLENNRISVLATSIRMPESDGLELIAYMTQKFPSTPIVAILDEDDPKPWFSDRDGHAGVLYYIEKPFSFGQLASAIFVGLNLRDEGLSHKGLAMKNFLPLVVIGKKTCRLEVRLSAQKKGFLYFREGKLIDAHTEETAGEAAAKEMAGWQGVQLAFSRLPADRQKRKIKSDTMTVAKATWKKDTKAAAVKEATAPPTPPKPPKGASKLETALLKNVNILRTIKGYKGLAIINSEGKVLAKDVVDESIDFSAYAEMISGLFIHCTKTMAQKGMEKCQGMSLHTPQGILIMRATDLYAGGNFRFLGMMNEDGNSFFMELQLKTIIPKILSELG